MKRFAEYIDGVGVPASAEVAVPGQEQLDARAAEGGQSPSVENPTSRQAVHEWIMARVAADEQMRWAGTARKARERAQEEQS